MEARYEARKQELLEECTVAPQVFDRVMPRLERFMDPFIESLVRREQAEHASTMVQGLLSDLQRKNAESIGSSFRARANAVAMVSGHVALGSRAAGR